MGTVTGPRQLFVRPIRRHVRRGVLIFGWLRLSCALGQGGVRALKREGDGATPLGVFRLRRVLYRGDKLRRPATGLPVGRIQRRDGWCDEPADRNYNRPVRHPYPASAERLWRNDDLYDLVVVIGHNDRPRMRGGGSAVFMHVARNGYEPTAGCVALKRSDLLKLLPQLNRRTRMRIAV